jgi:hypothetical protein
VLDRHVVITRKIPKGTTVYHRKAEAIKDITKEPEDPFRYQHFPSNLKRKRKVKRKTVVEGERIMRKVSIIMAERCYLLCGGFDQDPSTRAGAGAQKRNQKRNQKEK